MSEIDKRKPAFPTPVASKGPYGVESSKELGMSLRDYFAAKAIQGICANPSYDDVVIAGMVKEAYQIADAMLSARGEA